MVANCENCPLKSQPQVPPLLVKNSDYLFVGSRPSLEDVEANEPFVNAGAGQFFHEFIAPLREKFTLSFTNVVLCRPPLGKAPTQKQFLPCLARLEEDIKYCNPKLLVLLGKTAMTAVLGTGGRLSQVNGRVLSSYPYPVVCCFHPDSAVRPEGYKNFETGMLAVIHFFDKEKENNYKPLSERKIMRGLWAIDLETTGLRPCGIDTSREEGRIEHAGLIRCVGVSNGEESYYSTVEEEKV